MKSSRAAFTLIELLVVIAIIAVLSVVVVLSLNPAELLRQSRDANRLSDLSTLNSALALYTTDQAGVSGFSLGSASSVYVSLPDSSSTCGTWNLPTLPSGYTYACSTSTSSKNINTTGWIPINFSNISGGAPFSNLPIDSTNQSSTGLYYTYYSNGNQFMVTAIPESQKQKTALGANTIVASYPDVMANGSNMTISPLFSTSGLMGWWPFNEGSGSSTLDQSGNNNNGTWQGTAAGQNNTYYTNNAKVGNYAGFFNGTNDLVTVPTKVYFSPTSNALTIMAWVNQQSLSTLNAIVAHNVNWDYTLYGNSSSKNGLYVWNSGGSQIGGSLGSVSAANTWMHVAAVIDYPNLKAYMYTNGQLISSSTISGVISNLSGVLMIGQDAHNSASYIFNGFIDDVRLYNRALSPAEIQAIYNAER